MLEVQDQRHGELNGRPWFARASHQSLAISENETMLHDTERPEPAPTSDHLTIEQRLTRLEAWMRHEIFARTAMDEPEPAPAGEDDAAKWEAVLDAWNEGFERSPYPIDAHGVRAERHALKSAVAKAIDLGLAVSPDDPRLQPLDAESLIADVLGSEFYESPSHDWESGFDRGMGRAARLIVKHLNDERSAQ